MLVKTTCWSPKASRVDLVATKYDNVPNTSNATLPRVLYSRKRTEGGITLWAYIYIYIYSFDFEDIQPCSKCCRRSHETDGDVSQAYTKEKGPHGESGIQANAICY